MTLVVPLVAQARDAGDWVSLIVFVLFVVGGVASQVLGPLLKRKGQRQPPPQQQRRGPGDVSRAEAEQERANAERRAAARARLEELGIVVGGDDGREDPMTRARREADLREARERSARSPVIVAGPSELERARDEAIARQQAAERQQRQQLKARQRQPQQNQQGEQRRKLAEEQERKRTAADEARRLQEALHRQEELAAESARVPIAQTVAASQRKPSAAARIREVLKGKQNVRSAVLLADVLSPPKALREG